MIWVWKIVLSWNYATWILMINLYGDPMEESSSTPTNVDSHMGREEEEEGSDEFVDSGMEEDY